MPTSKMAASSTSLYNKAKDTVRDNQDGLETTESAKSFIEVQSNKPVKHMLTSIFERCMDRKLKHRAESRRLKFVMTEEMKKTSELEEKINGVQQKERQNNAIITGMEESDPTIEDIRRLLNKRQGLSSGDIQHEAH